MIYVAEDLAAQKCVAWDADETSENKLPLIPEQIGGSRFFLDREEWLRRLIFEFAIDRNVHLRRKLV